MGKLLLHDVGRLLETLSPEHEVADCTCVRNNPQGGVAPLRLIGNCVILTY